MANAIAAKLEGKISLNKTVDDELNRLYNIMLVNSDNKNLVILVFKDYLNILRNERIKEDNKYIYLAEDINGYLLNYNEFPFLSDYQ